MLSRIARVCAGLLFLSAIPCLATQPTDAEAKPSTHILRVVMDDNYPPYVFRDSGGVLQGYLIDSWTLWSQKTGVRVDLKAMDWELAKEEMAQGHADVIDTIFRTEARERYLDFTAPYVSIPVTIYTNAKIGGIVDTNTLHGFLVAVEDGDACATMLEKAGVTSLKKYPNYESIVRAAIANEIQVFCLDEPPANYLIYRFQAEDRFRKAFDLYTGQFHRAVHKGDSATLKLVESGFDMFTSSERQTLQNKWMGSKLDLLPYGRYVAYAASVAVCVSSLLMLWGVALRKEVKKRTQQLESERAHLNTLLKSIPDMVWMKNAEGVYLNCNAVFEQLVNRDTKDILGKTDHDFFQKEQADAFRGYDNKAVLAGKPVSNEEEVVYASDGHHSLLETIKTPVHDQAGRLIGILGIARDITQRKQAEEQIRQLAHFDTLTKLPNRGLLNDRITQAISMAQRSGDSIGVLLIDLDHFKKVNDALGHHVGDDLLVQISERLRSCLREEDTVSRIGGDEFVILLPNTDADGAAHVANKLIEGATPRFNIDHHEFVVTLSVGIAMYPEDGGDFSTLYRCADLAMYRSKQEGRNSFRFYAPDMQARLARSLRIEGALRQALKRDELMLYYQPQISLVDGRIVGAEALLRWNSAEMGIVAPAEFISVAEETGQIEAIGEWVLRNALAQFAHWHAAGLGLRSISVNVSAKQFRQGTLPETIAGMLSDAGVSAEHLELELTEGVAMDNPQNAIAIMGRLNKMGVHLSIDDFGTGYSSLSYLKKFQVNKLKIDQSFVRDITIDPEDKAIVLAIISMAKSLDMHTIAEGVEDIEQLAYLRDQGCDEVQGYYFSRPLPVKEFEAYVRSRH